MSKTLHKRIKRHMKVVTSPSLHNGQFTLQEIFRVLISVRGYVDSLSIVRPEGLCQ